MGSSAASSVSIWHRLPIASLSLLLIFSGLAGMSLGPQKLTPQGWIDPLLDLPGVPLIVFGLACLGFIWGALAPQRRSPLIQPLWMALSSFGISLGVGVSGGLIHCLLTLSVFAVGQMISEAMGMSMSPAALGDTSGQMQEILQFSVEIGLWLAGLVMLTALAGSIFQRLRSVTLPCSLAILTTLLIVGVGLNLGWEAWSWSWLASMVLLITAVSLPIWVYEQAEQRNWGQGIAVLVTLPLGVLGIGAGWGLCLGFEQVLPSITFAFATLLVAAPAVIVFELCQQQGMRGSLAVALSATALLIPAMGLGLGLLSQGQGLTWIERLL